MCGRDDGACRYNQEDPDFIQCHTYQDERKGAKVNGYVCVKESNGHTASFKPDNSEEWSEEQRQKWRAEAQSRRQARQVKYETRKEQALSLEERDKQYRKLLDSLTLSESDRKDLTARGFTNDEIKLGGFKSVSQFHKLQGEYSDLLPGIANYYEKSTILTGEGYICPIRNKDNLIVALQVRLRVIGDKGQRYQWATSKTKKNPDGQTPHVYPEGSSTGELPLAIFKPEKPKGIALAEGTGAKPLFVSQRFEYYVIGAAGGLWESSPITFKETLVQASKELGGTTEIIIYPDAGDVLNKSVMSRWEKLVKLLKDCSYSVKFGWWGQVTKEHDDIDELPESQHDSIKYISPSEFYQIAKKCQSEQKAKDKIESDDWKFWRKSRIFSADFIFNSKYFDFEVPQPGSVIAINSGTGTGKTRWLINKLLESYKDKGFVSIGYRNSILLQFCEDVKDFYHLQKDLKKNAESIMISDVLSKIACCVDSLIHFSAQDFNDRILILDEIESIVKHLFQANTTVNMFRDKIKALFVEALNRASVIVLLDGHLSDNTVKYIQSLIKDPKKVIKVKNEYQGNKGTVKFLEGANSKGKLKADDYSSIYDSITKNEGAFAIVSDSQNKLEALDSLLKDKGKKTLRLDSTTSNQPWVQTFTANPEKFIKQNKIDVLLYSPSAEAGLNIDIKGYFSDIYVLFFGVISTNPQLQMIARVRDPEAIINIYCTSFGFPSSCVSKATLPDKVIQECLNYIHECGKKSFEGLEQKEQVLELCKKIIELSNDSHFKHESILMALENHERNNLRECLKEALIESGYDVQPFVSEKFCTKELKDRSDEVKLDYSKKVFTSADISSTEADRIASKLDATLEEKAQVVKSKLLSRLPGIENATYTVEEKTSETNPTQKAELPTDKEASATPDTSESLPNPEPEQSSNAVEDVPVQPINVVENPIFSTEFIKQVLIDDRSYISKLEFYWLLQNPEVAKELQQIKWHKKLAIFTDPEEQVGRKKINLTTYKSQWLKISKLEEMGISFFLQAEAKWSVDTKEVIEFYNKGKKPEFHRYIGIKVGNSSPIEFLGRVLRSLGLKTHCDKSGSSRTYSIDASCLKDPIRNAILESIDKRITAQLTESRQGINFNEILEQAKAQEEAKKQKEEPVKKTVKEPVKEPVKASPTVAELAAAQLRALKNWGDCNLSQEEIDAGWPLLTSTEQDYLDQIYQQYRESQEQQQQQQQNINNAVQQAIQAQTTVREFGFGIEHFRSYRIIKLLENGIALVKRCFGDKAECEVLLTQLLI